MKIRERVPISTLTTMRLGGEARYVLEVEKLEDVKEAFRFAKERNLPVWLMGEGANTIGRDEGFDGVIIRSRLKGIELLDAGSATSKESTNSESNGNNKSEGGSNGESDSSGEETRIGSKNEVDNQKSGGSEANDTDEHVLVRAMAGEIWDDLVAFTCEHGLTGIEAMSMIPGTVGAAPVQNIGAYGQEIGNVLYTVEAYDTKTDKMVILSRSELKMGYRATTFNHGADMGRYYITAVTLRLRRGEMQPPFYRSLEQYIVEHGERDFSPLNIRKMVSAIRSAKLPDPTKVASAGSFFKNVYLNQVEADEAEERGIPVWRLNDDSGKVNSGWLIEAAGLKGRAMFGFRVSEKAALVLINESAKSYADLAKAREKIVETVKEKFGFTLEQEPVEIPSAASRVGGTTSMAREPKSGERSIDR